MKPKRKVLTEEEIDSAVMSLALVKILGPRHAFPVLITSVAGYLRWRKKRFS